MSKSKSIYAVVALFAIAIVIAFVLASQDKNVTAQAPMDVDEWRIVIIGSDAKLYVIDITGEETVFTSDEIVMIGAPTSVTVNSGGTRIYISSEVDRQQSDTCVIGEFVLQKENLELSRCIYILTSDSAELGAYRLRLSPDDKHLFAGIAGGSRSGTTVFDLGLNKEIRNVPAVIDGRVEFSPDGRVFAELWPAGYSEANGEAGRKNRKWPGGVVVRDLSTGDEVSRVELVENQNLSPPWGSESDKFVYVRPRKHTIEIFDRNTGEQISSLNLERKQNLRIQDRFLHVNSRLNLIAITAVDSSGGGHILGLDATSLEILYRVSIPTVPMGSSTI